MRREFLEELLSYVSKDPAAMANKLIERHSNFLEIAEATDDSLSQTVGGYEKCAFYLKLCVAIASRRLIDNFDFGKKHTESEMREYLAALLFGLSEENVYMLSLDSAGRCIAADKVGEGIVNFSSVLPRKVIDVAKRRGASSVILAHNHPGAYPEPSANDISATGILSDFLHSAQITLEKSYVVSGMEYAEIKK